MLANQRWSVGNVVLLGDALGSAAFAQPPYPYAVDTRPSRGIMPNSEQLSSPLDSIDPISGKLHIQIPLASLPLGNAGSSFDLALTTLGGRHIEAEGRALGGRAVLRMRDVSGARRDFADLAARHDLKTIALIGSLARPAIIKGALELARKQGLEVVVHETFPSGTTDFSVMLNQVKAVTPDVLVVGAPAPDAIAITRQMRDLDVDVKMFSATPGGAFPDYAKALEKTAEFAYAGSFWDPGLPYPGNPEFVDIAVNGIPHQLMAPAQWKLEQGEQQYSTPYERIKANPMDDVLIVGAGSGSDVAIALSKGAKHVDAVDIDPRIMQIG